MAWRDRLEASWYANARAPWWCWPLALLYRGLVASRRLAYQRRWLRAERLPVPVLVVGNLSVGGTGKTPLTQALVLALRQRGLRPGVVSRGYGGSERGPVLLGSAGKVEPARFGDEPCLLHADGAVVAIGRDRAAAAMLLLEAGCDLVIADDGLQHYRLARDLEICVIDGQRRFGNRRLLPLGPLREPLERLAQVDWRVCNGGHAEPGEVPMWLSGDQMRSLLDGVGKPVASLRGQAVNAVAAIGHPQRFFESLRRQGLLPQTHVFPDHHAYRAEDFAFDDGRPLLMTEKDAIKCASLAQPNWWSLPVRAELPDAFLDELELAIRRRMAELSLAI